MNTSSKSNTLRFLSSINTDHLQYDTKLGILFFHNQIYSPITEAVILFLEYFQLVGQIFLFNTALYPDSMSNQNSLLNLIIDASKLVHPGSFLINHGVHTYNLVVSIVLGLLMMKYSLTVYICIVALKNRKQDGFFIGLWRWIFKLQGRVLYLLISSVLMEAALAASNDRVKTFGLAETGILAICVILICIDYIFALILHVRFCYVLPTKSILSAKDSILETSTLTQKFITQILHLCFSSVTGCGWIIGIINLVFSLVRVAYFFKTLPLYKVNILLYQGVLISTVTISNLTCLIQIIANSTNKNNVDIDSVLISWILISLLAIKIVQGCLNYYIVSLVRSYTHISPKLLLHKVYALKQFIKLSSTVEFGNKVHWLAFVKTTVKSNAMSILNADSRFLVGDKEVTDSKDSIMKMSIQYLERLLEKFPDSDVIKLYIIYYYAKKLKNYGTALKMIHDLRKDSSKLLLLNASLMLYDLQNQIFANNNKLNVSEYTRNVSTVAQWKFYMLGQVDLQISLCEETMTEIPDLAKIFNLAQKMDHYRSAVEEKSDTVFKTIPGHYIEPYMIYAHYQLVVNHSVAEYREYVRYHSKRYKQYEKSFKNNDMMAENIYHNTGFMICSAQKANFGKILFCTKGIADIFGGDIRRYVGSDVNIFAAPATRPFYTLFYRNFVDSRTSNAETSVFRGFSIHKDGYIFELDFCLDVYLFESQGLCICGMGRKVLSNKDYLLVHENGEIEGISRKLGRKLGFFQNKESALPKINISSLSQQLGRANQAFNIITLPEKFKPNETEAKQEVYEVHEDSAENDNYFNQKYDMNIEEATHLHTIFSSEGKEIVIKIPKKTVNQASFTECYTYNCTIKTMNYGSLQLKTFTLEEIVVHIENMKSPPSLKHIEELTLEDEKQDGWIDFNRLESDSQQPRQISIGTDNRIFTTLRTQEEQLLSPSKNLLSERLPLFQNLSPMTTPTENQIDFFKQKRSLDEKSKSSDEDDHEESELSESDIVKPQQSISSQISQSSNSDATLKAYKTALLNSATSRTFKVLCFCFYSLLILLFSSQIKLKYSLSDFLTQLEIKKNILGDSSKRDTAVAGVHGNANALLLTYNTIIGGQNTTEWNATLALYDIGMQQQLTLVDTSNSALLVDMQYLNEKTSQLFFQQDVKVYDTYFNATQQVYMTENNFEAIASILQTGARALQKAILWDFTNLNDFYFLFRNCENDVLIKSIALGDILDQSLTDERVAAESLVIDYLIVTLVLLGVIAVALYVLIWKQYLTERNNLLAFVKLDPQSIETVHSMLIEFKYKVENERSFEKTTIDLAEYIQPTIKGRNARGITVYKKHLQTANYRGILRKYLLHIVKLTVFILIFMSLVLWSNLSAKVSIQFFHTKQIQLRLAGQMKFRTTMTAIVSDELLFRNNGSQVFNQWTADLAPSSLNDLVALRNDLTTGLRNDNGQYDPVIADILFDSGRCDLLPSDGQVFCQTLKANGILLNYMSVLVSWENLLRLRYEQYLALTNKTISVLIGIRTALGPMFRPLRSVLLYQSDAIYKVINRAFEANLNTVANDRNTIFAIITVALVVLSIIAWFSLLRLLKEANNQFKKVLQSLPAHIVLQSFLLRLFLMGNSTTTLKVTVNT